MSGSCTRSFTSRLQDFFDDSFGNAIQQDTIKGGKWSNGAEMTEEEALAEQQRMFAEARARMNGVASVPKQSELDPSLES